MDAYTVSLNVWAFAAVMAAIVLVFFPTLWIIKKSGGRVRVGKWSLSFDAKPYTYQRAFAPGMKNTLVIPKSVIQFEGKGWQVPEDLPAFEMLKTMWGANKGIDISKATVISYMQSVLLDVAQERSIVIYCKESQLSKLPGLQNNANIEIITKEAAQ